MPPRIYGVASLPSEETIRHPFPLSQKAQRQLQQFVEPSSARKAKEEQLAEGEDIRLLREIRKYLHLMTTKGFYLSLPSNMIRVNEFASWITYNSGGGTFAAGEVNYFSITTDLQFMAALIDAADIQGGVPIQCEPYELFGYVNFFSLVNGVAPNIRQYTYQIGATIFSASGCGILSKNYAVSSDPLPSYAKPGDYVEIKYEQLQVPLRDLAKVGMFSRSFILDKKVMEDIGIVAI